MPENPVLALDEARFAELVSSHERCFRKVSRLRRAIEFAEGVLSALWPVDVRARIRLLRFLDRVVADGGGVDCPYFSHCVYGCEPDALNFWNINNFKFNESAPGIAVPEKTTFALPLSGVLLFLVAGRLHPAPARAAGQFRFAVHAALERVARLRRRFLP